MSDLMARVCAGIVGAVFAVAAAGKFISFREWIADARNQGVPRLVALCIPPLELVLGVALIASPAGASTTAFVLGVSTTVLLVFTAFVAVSVATGRNTSCACFGARSRRVMSWRDVVRNLELIALLAISAALQ